MKNKIIPIFFSCDDGYLPFLSVAIQSLEDNASKKYLYKMMVLNDGNISGENQKIIIDNYKKDNFDIEFVNIAELIKPIYSELHTRDYYTKTTYYRLFIPNLYPQYDKALYLDADITVVDDISKLYNTDIGDNYIGGSTETYVASLQVFRDYVEQTVGMDTYKDYVNAGILIMNLKEMRKIDLQSKFLRLLEKITFVVAQDQDYLNAICKGKIYLFERGWNTEPVPNTELKEKDVHLVHYMLTYKPWHIDGVLYEKYFWEYAKKTPYYEKILAIKNNYSKSLQEKSELETQNLIKKAEFDTKNETENLKISQEIKNVMGKDYSQKNEKLTDRLNIIKKIEEFEEKGLWDKDVEDDPPTYILKPDKVDYLNKKIKSKINAKISHSLAKLYLKKIIRKKQLQIKSIYGLENLSNLKTGAVLTSNHFNPFDNFAIQYAFEKSEQKRKKLYTVIREGNFTNFPGFYGFLMRHCYTLPLSSDSQTMRNFLNSVNQILRNGDVILVYPEQSLWWNYKKPKPLKKGAFDFAVSANVPVIPCFVTMEDGDLIGEDGFPIQEYTIHIEKPIYPSIELSKAKNIEQMMEKNSELWKDCYENFYGIKLVYKTKKMA